VWVERGEYIFNCVDARHNAWQQQVWSGVKESEEEGEIREKRERKREINREREVLLYEYGHNSHGERDNEKTDPPARVEGKVDGVPI
jgi:hypothetical protein